MTKDDGKIYVAGHRGLVGSALVRALTRAGAGDRICTTSHAETDLRDAAMVERFFERERPAYVLLAAAKVGGIGANAARPAEFIRDNLLIETHVIDAAYRYGVKKLLFLGSSCIYPKFAPQPIPESALMTGALEPTNQAYALAKIAGIELCRSYRVQYGFDAISVMPTNLYGPGDNFDLVGGHVLPSLIRRFDEAKRQNAQSVTLWGSGQALREFLHVDDLADACLFLMDRYDDEETCNIGTGEEVTIADLADRIRRTVGASCEILWDRSKPDGTPRKVVDCRKLMSLGFKPRISLDEGLRSTYAWYQAHFGQLRGF